jgi:hypothetical protein
MLSDSCAFGIELNRVYVSLKHKFGINCGATGLTPGDSEENVFQRADVALRAASLGLVDTLQAGESKSRLCQQLLFLL